MSQPIVINIGALPNDGTGDPLRTAFNDVNLNFANVFAAGPVGSNVQIANNTILTTNTNGNLVLAPNGIGVVQSNVDLVPNQTRVHNLGSANRLWDTTYTQYLNATSATIGTANIGNIGILNIGVANLHILGGTNGYVLQTDGTGNLTWTAQTGGTGNAAPAGANTQIQYNDAGNLGATAGFTFDNTSNVLSVPGNIDVSTLTNSGNITIDSDGNIWTFDNTGSTIFPTLNVQRGDNPSGTITGQTLLFGDATQEAIISTPDGSNADGINSQRLVINPGKGEDSNGGEGGDIYLWAGRGGNNNGSGGDVKIRGGYAPADGTGGYIRMDGGESQGNGAPGFIEITGGQGGTTSGGYVQITGGVAGSGTGGAVDIIGGFGQAGPGAAVTITGGGSANGLAEYGNVNIGSGASTWSFRNNGTTTFPNNTIKTPNNESFTTRTQSSGNAYTETYQSPNSWEAYAEDDTTEANSAYAWIKADLITANTPRVFITNTKASDGVELTWTFDDAGNLTLPNNTVIGNAVSQTTQGPAVNSFGSNSYTGTFTTLDYASLDTTWIVNGPGVVNGTIQSIDAAGQTIILTRSIGSPQFQNGQSYTFTGPLVGIGTDITVNSNTWTLGADGSTTFPNGIEFAQQNQIRATNDNDYLEIHGYSPAEGGGEAAVFYGGDAGSTGNSVYTGGSARITGGRGVNGGEGGYVRLRTYAANNSSTSLYFYPGGNLELPDAGVLWNNGGLTTLQAGNNGAQIGSGDGQSYVIANVDGTYMQTLADTTNSLWHFGTDGNLTLPKGGVVSEGAAPTGLGNTIAITPSGGSDADQQLLVYPTGNVVDGNHLHLTTGNLLNTELYLGNDDFYVKLANTGNIIVNTAGNTAQWTFGTNGNLTLPGNTFAVNYANGDPATFTANTGNVTFSDQIVIGTGISNLVSGLYLAPSSSSANAAQYLRVRGDVTYEPTHIHFDTGNNQYFNQFIGDDSKYVLLSNIGDIVIRTDDYAGNSAQWTFGANGNLNVPQGGYIGAAGVKGDGTMLTGGKGNIASLTSFYSNVDALNYSSCVTVNADGTLNITTYGDGTGQLGQWTFSSANLLLASQNVSGNVGESALLAGTRKIVNGQYSGAAYGYSAELAAGGTPSVAYTATNEYVQSARLTFAVESIGSAPQWEQFDVVATKSLDTPGSVNFVVSNRIKARASIADTTVTATINLANEIEISLNLDAAQTTGGWSSFDAVEFGVMFN